MRALSSPDLDAWIQQQTAISHLKLEANISPANTRPGAVVASPSRQDPDYFYVWTRDAALVMDTVAGEYKIATGPRKAELWRLLSDYVNFTRVNQVSNALEGQGEPKFMVDGSPFMGPWNRPQNDGPALRAMTLTRLAKTLLAEGQQHFVQQLLYDGKIPARTAIKADLEYVAHHWRESSFDLWEEVRADHFYTRLVQMKALREGSAFAREMGDIGGADFYLQQANEVSNSLPQFWDAQAGIIQVSRNRVGGLDYKTSGIDSAVILGVLHAGPGLSDFSVLDARVLSTAHKMEDAFKSIYRINDAHAFPGAGVAIGRYPEDTYSGTPGILHGNPWVLSTLALGELHYRVSSALAKADALKIDAVNVNFFRQVQTAATGDLAPGVVIAANTPAMIALRQSLVVRGDTFFARVRLHANPDGSLSEQIERNTGYMISAPDLTWSYASVLTAAAARGGQ